VIDLARIGGPVACLGLALLFVATTRRDRLAGLGFAAFGACLLGAAIAPHRPLEIVGGTLILLAVAALLAALFLRVPWLFPLLALACVPIRVGVHVGGASSKLLVPLYVVILGAVVKLGWELVHGDERLRELRLAAWPLAAYIGWAGLSVAWSKDVQQGAIELLAF
jgi:hypothetical protein